MHKAITITPAQAAHGVTACLRNAQRLSNAASALFATSDVDAVAYVLWSVAVEELGKALILRRLLPATAGANVSISRKLWMDHDRKFREGSGRLKDGSPTAAVLNVPSNRRQKASTWRVGKHGPQYSTSCTGQYQDVTPGVD